MVLLAALLNPAHAAATGGLAVANQTAIDVRNAIYVLCGTISGLYLLYLGLMAKIEKKSWSDFGMGVVHCFTIGGAVSLGAWAYALGGS